MGKVDDLQNARVLAGSGRFPEAWTLIERWLSDDTDDPQAIIVANYLNVQARNYPNAYLYARRLSELLPRDPAAWINLSQACKFLQREKEGERAAKRGLEVASKPEDKQILLLNLSSLYIDAGRFEEAQKILKRVLESDPLNVKARGNLGMCQLALHNWQEGWANYHYMLGTEDRLRQVYREPAEPEWEGAPGQKVLIYGEQGLGDEVCFASMIPDALERCEKLILNVDRRLEGLFRRSFPHAEVRGNRELTVAQGAKWKAGDDDVDASLCMGQLGEFFRLDDKDFPAEPYLVADPDRVFMWKSLFAGKKKPVIGLAWTGGLFHTGAKFRACGLEQLLPLMRSIDAHWVSLQYKDASAEIAQFREKHPEIDLVQYAHATVTKDYDDTAALVKALDLVMGVPTAVIHLAAALGTSCIAMKSSRSCWKFHQELAFHPTVQLIEHAGSWEKTVAAVVHRLESRFRSQEAA